MFKKFKDSPYTKASLTILICGALLIIFNSWISKNRISIGFENINSTLAPVYIGVVFAFILCPVYNACVRFAYGRMLVGARRKGFSIGAMIISSGDLEVDKVEKRKILGAARIVASLVCIVLVLGLIGLLIYFVVPQVVASGVNLVNTLPERLNVLSDWCESHLRHFPMIAVWVDNLANKGKGALTLVTAGSITGTPTCSQQGVVLAVTGNSVRLGVLGTTVIVR